MGFLDNFEKGLERIVNGAFTKTFKSELQPVEISGQIKAEMDSKASILGRDRILAPNTFTVSLSTPDFKRMQSLGDSLITELTDLATKHAKKQGFQFGAALSLRLIEDPSMNLGQVSVRSATQNLEIEWMPSIEVADKRFFLKVGQTTVGRDGSADVQIADSGLSRQHFAVIWDGKNAAVRDLGSTNGTRVGGRTIKEVAIGADTEIQAGSSSFVFRVTARTASDDASNGKAVLQ